MDCSEYRSNHKQYTNFAIPKEVWDTPHYSDWQQHQLRCRECEDWSLAREVLKRGHDPTTWPCVHIAGWVTFTCKEHPNLWECSDAIVGYDKRFDEYSIMPRGGSGDGITIQYCPACGAELPESQRDAYFEALEALGLDFEDAPTEFDDDTWRKGEPQR